MIRSTTEFVTYLYAMLITLFLFWQMTYTGVHSQGLTTIQDVSGSFRCEIETEDGLIYIRECVIRDVEFDE